MICYLRTSAASFDIRLQKYILACQQSNTPYIAITWDRLMHNKQLSLHEIQFKHYAPYGLEHRLHNFFLYIRWSFFALFNLIKLRKNYTIIHACNLETIVVAFILKLLFRKKIIFDIYDTSGKYRLERFFAKRANLFILPHDLRAQQIGLPNTLKNLFVVENVPYFNNYKPNYKHPSCDGDLHISYVGTFQRNIRGIENLIRLTEAHKNIFCDIAGSGDGLEKDIIQASKRCARIKYHGTLMYDEALDLMAKSDIMYACYYLIARTHKYASPNKYYESLFLGKPLITSKNTLVGKRVEDGNTGYTIGDSYEDLEKLISTLSAGTSESFFSEKGLNAIMIWKNTYANYFDQRIKGEYINHCVEISKHA